MLFHRKHHKISSAFPLCAEKEREELEDVFLFLMDTSVISGGRNVGIIN